MLEARTSGQGQIVDAAMIDGIESLLTHYFAFIANDRWVPERESKFFDGGAPWYGVYETRDGKYVSVAPVERKFYEQLVEAMGLDPLRMPDQLDRETWPELRRQFAEIFRTKTRDEWCEVMEGRDACFAPVLSIEEAIAHPHFRARKSFVEVDGVLQPAPAPRFSGTPSSIHRAPPVPGSNTDEIMSGGVSRRPRSPELRKSGAIRVTMGKP